MRIVPDAAKPPEVEEAIGRPPLIVGNPVRLAALDGLAILDTPAEQGFDDVVRLASRLCATPVALVSLVAADRQWFKARVGFPHCETDLDSSVCAHVLSEPDLLVIEDLTADPRTVANPLVKGEPNIRFYAGAPLRLNDGQVVGSLCVIDTVPRPGGLTAEQADDLRALSRQVSDLLEMRRSLGARDAFIGEQARARKERHILTRTQAAVGSAGGNLDVILDAITAGAMEAVPAAEGAVVEFLHGEELEYRATAGTLISHRGLRVSLNDSLAGRCVRSGSPIMAEDALRDGQVKPALAERLGLRSAVLAPIERSGRMVGVLKLQAKLAGAFSERDFEMVRLFAGAATTGLTAVAEVEAEQARRQGERRLRLLARISAALLTATDPARAVEAILTANAANIGFEQSYLYDVDPDGRHLRLVHAIGASDEVRGALACVEVASPLCGLVVETREAVVLQHVMASTAPRYALARATGINAFAGYPIMSRGALVGVVSFCSSSEPAFDAEALTFFETVARYLSAVRERLDGDRALRDSDARSRRAQEAGHVGTFEVDVDTGLMGVSPEFARIYGRPATGLYSTDAFESLIVPEDRGVGSSEETRQTGTARPDVEYRVRRADDGELRWIARRATFERDGAGRVVRMFGTVQDVTEQRVAQEALRASEERFRTIMETVDAAFAIVEVKFDADDRPVDYRFVEANPAFERQSGVNLRGKWVTEFAPDLERFWFDTYGHVAKTGVPANFENYAEAFKRWFDVRAVRVGNPDERRIAILFNDVTARKQAEADLRASEALARESEALAHENAERVQLALAAGAIIGTWHWDLPSDRFTVDEAFARSFGLDPALGREGIPLAQIVATVHPDDQAGLAEAINEVIARGGAYAHQYRVRRADGHYYWIEANGRVDYASDGTPKSFPGVLLDIEERRAADTRRDALLALGERLREADGVPALVHAAAEIMAGTLGATRAGYGFVDAGRETVDIPTGWCAAGVASIAGPHRFRAYGNYIDALKRGEVVAVDDVERDPRSQVTAAALLAIGVRAFINVPIMERGQIVGVGFVHHANAHAFTEDELAFVGTVADQIQTAVARMRAEADQRVLNEEISHRLKNSFAMVLSIAGQTLRTISDRAPVEAFEKRIHALSQAHDVLLRKSWMAAPAKDVVKAVLAGAGHSDRIDVSGPEIDLGPRATLSLSLLLHELATNAAKYGALSVPTGRVAIDWWLEGEGEKREVILDWIERGGPPAAQPSSGGRKGFGSRLIGMGLAGTGGVDLRYSAQGFEATMRAPLAQLQHF